MCFTRNKRNNRNFSLLSMAYVFHFPELFRNIRNTKTGTPEQKAKKKPLLIAGAVVIRLNFIHLDGVFFDYPSSFHQCLNDYLSHLLRNNSSGLNSMNN